MLIGGSERLVFLSFAGSGWAPGRPVLSGSPWFTVCPAKPLPGEEVQQKVVDRVGSFQLYPVVGAVDAFIAPGPGHVLGRIGHLCLGEGDVAALQIPMVGACTAGSTTGGATQDSG